MKKNILIINGVLAALFASSPLVSADTQYPAADFQPQVVFQDSDYIEKSGKSESVSSSSNEVDSKYPAANFQPQVVYSDPSYKHTESAPSIGKKAVAAVAMEAQADKEISNKEAASAEKSDSTLYMILLAAAAVLAGAYVFRNQGKPSETAAEASASAKTPGVTGVARYINKKAGTGVSRYLEKQVKTAATATGVAKYVAKQAVSAKTKATEAATGVEKYMRNRG